MSTTPGSNQLTDAFELICPEPFDYYRFTGMTTNAVGIDVRSYAAAVTARGSVQPVDRSKYGEMGLDFTRRYIQVWTDTDVMDLYRERAGDQIGWNSARWEIQSENDWHIIDGWNRFTAIQVPVP